MELILGLLVFSMILNIIKHVPFSYEKRDDDIPYSSDMMSNIFKIVWGVTKFTIKGTVTMVGWAIPKLQFHLQPKGDLNAKWMSPTESRELMNPANDGVVISGKNRLSEAASFRHLAIIASTGSGKTQKFIIPNAIQLKSSAVITDPSGEIFRKTSGYLASQGFKIKVLNFDDPEHSLRYNPLTRAVDEVSISQVANQLLDSSKKKGDKQEAFWTEGAKAILNILIACLKNEPQKFRNLHNIRYLLNNFGMDGGPLGSFFLRSIAVNPALKSEIKGITHQTESVISGQVGTAKTALEPMRNPSLCELTSRETLHFETLREEKTVLYVIYSPHRINEYQFLLNLLYTQLFDFVVKPKDPGKPYLPVYFLLDEFGNLGTIPSFSTIITTIRKFQCSISMILQDLNQLETNYSEAEAKTIFEGGCATRIFYSGMDHDMAERLEKMLGKFTIRRRDRNGAYIEKDRPLQTADELRMLPRETAVMIHDTMKPVKLQLVPADRDPQFSSLMALPPLAIPSEKPRSLFFVPL